MLYFIEAALSHNEIPGESSLIIYISGCTMRCKNCHYPDLQKCDYGDLLDKAFYDLLDAYQSQISCVCFLGEGQCGNEEVQQFKTYASVTKARGKRVGLYSGRDIEKPESWMGIFDYVKIGSYIEEKGPLTSETTNQRMYYHIDCEWRDITKKFWK